MIKIIQLDENDILHDAAAAGEALNKAVRRGQLLRFTGLCPIGREILFVFHETIEKDQSDRGSRFFFAPLDSCRREDVSATILQRFIGGYDTLGTFFLDDTLWGLFRKQKEEHREVENEGSSNPS